MTHCDHCNKECANNYKLGELIFCSEACTVAHFENNSGFTKQVENAKSASSPKQSKAGSSLRLCRHQKTIEECKTCQLRFNAVNEDEKQSIQQLQWLLGKENTQDAAAEELRRRCELMNAKRV